MIQLTTFSTFAFALLVAISLSNGFALKFSHSVSRTSSRLFASAGGEALNGEKTTQLGIVTMYKKEGCPHCKKATTLLQDKYGLKISFVDIQAEPM
jgi:hypothetical protein